MKYKKDYKKNKDNANCSYIEIIDIKPSNKPEINEYNNHKFLYDNNSKEKNRKLNKNYSNPILIKKEEIMRNNRKYKVEKVINNDKNDNINNHINNNNIYIIDNNNKYLGRKNKTENNFYKKNKANYLDISLFIETMDKRIEKIRKTLKTINVIDDISEHAGLQSFNNQNNNDDILYNKTKELNKEFYDNLDINIRRIEEFLNKYENK